MLSNKTIYFQIKDHDFSTGNFNSSDDAKIDGNKKARENLARRLRQKKGAKRNKYSGAYLVTGYEGMGKTTLIKGVIDGINTEETSHNIDEINVSITRDNLSYFDILRQIFLEFHKEVTKRRRIIIPEPRFRTAIVLFLSLFLTIICVPIIDSLYEFLYECLCNIFHWKSNPFELKTDQIYGLITVLRFSLYFVATTLVVRGTINLLIKFSFKERIKFFSKLDEIHNRIQSNLEVSAGNEKNESFTSLTTGSSLLNRTLSSVRDQIFPFKKMYEKLSPKELEFEIKLLLDRFEAFRNSFTNNSFGSDKNGKYNKIVFVIDELDKLHSTLPVDSEDYFTLGKSTAEIQRDTLKSLFTNIKSFINTANAKFVFVGGADMYDASLADIADRDSFYSSIFQEVIYVNSLYKEHYNSDENSSAVKRYLDRLLSVNGEQPLFKNMMVAGRSYEISEYPKFHFEIKSSTHQESNPQDNTSSEEAFLFEVRVNNRVSKQKYNHYKGEIDLKYIFVNKMITRCKYHSKPCQPYHSKCASHIGANRASHIRAKCATRV